MPENPATATSLREERGLTYRILRYVPNLVRDEWVNIGVLIFDSNSGERRLRMIEEQEEFARVRKLHPSADQEALRALREHLESRFDSAGAANENAVGWQPGLPKSRNTHH